MLAFIAPAFADGPSSGVASAPGAKGAVTSHSSDKAAVTGPLHFIADDGPAALAEAKRRGVPIFVEAWAPW
jgi:hypothetical protein